MTTLSEILAPITLSRGLLLAGAIVAWIACFQSRTRRIAIVGGVGLASMFLSFFSDARASLGGESVLGAVYSIAEPDALVEMEEAAAGKSVSLDDFGDSDDWTATASVLLPVAESDDTRSVAPFFSLPFDIPDGKGGVLYPAGFTFNPLEHVRLYETIWIAREEHLEWVMANAGDTDIVILSGGNALKASNRHRSPIYALQQDFIYRLDLRVAPSRVFQSGSLLTIEEFGPAAVTSQSRAFFDEKSAEGVQR